MSYGDFSFTEVLDNFNLITEESEGIFSDIKPKELSSLYQQTLVDYLKFVSLSSSAKLRSAPSGKSKVKSQKSKVRTTKINLGA